MIEETSFSRSERAILNLLVTEEFVTFKMIAEALRPVRGKSKKEAKRGIEKVFVYRLRQKLSVLAREKRTPEPEIVNSHGGGYMMREDAQQIVRRLGVVTQKEAAE